MRRETAEHSSCAQRLIRAQLLPWCQPREIGEIANAIIRHGRNKREPIQTGPQ